MGYASLAAIEKVIGHPITDRVLLMDEHGNLSEFDPAVSASMEADVPDLVQSDIG